jgi:hypothetical protein
MYGDLKYTFQQKVLDEYLQDTAATMQTVAARMKVKDTERLIQSIAHSSLQAGQGASAGSLTFDQVGRFIDMGVGRGHPLGGLKATKVALLSGRTGISQSKDRTRKPRKFYSKIAYGKLTWLENMLLYGYTEETIGMLKKQLEGKP